MSCINRAGPRLDRSVDRAVTFEVRLGLDKTQGPHPMVDRTLSDTTLTVVVLLVTLKTISWFFQQLHAESSPQPIRVAPQNYDLRRKVQFQE